MHSISLNKSIQLSLVFFFLLVSATALGQVNLSTKADDTKQFIRELIRIHGPSMKKMCEKHSSIVLADSTDREPVSDNGNYSFSFKIILENYTTLKFSASNPDTLRPAYSGKSDNLRKLFQDIDSHGQISKTNLSKAKNDFLPESLNVLLYSDSSFIKRYYNRMWRTYRRPDRLTLGFFGGVNFSTAFVSPFRYSDDTELKMQTRRENEVYLPTGIFGFSAGYTHYSHGVDLFFQHTNYGCKYVQGNQINWNTGFYGGNTAASDSMKLSIPINQFGIRYRYSNYNKVFSPYTSIGIHLSYVNKDSKNLMQLNSRYLSTGCNLALGLNIHPIYALDIHIAPIMNISFDAVKKTELQTRFSSIALEVGVRYNITFVNSKYKTSKDTTKKDTQKAKKTERVRKKEAEKEERSRKKEAKQEQ